MVVHATILERKQAAAAAARLAKRKKKKTKRHNLHPKPTAAIEPEKTYPLEIIPKLFGISRYTLQKAQTEGLKTSKLGSRKFISGKALIDFLKSRSA